MCFVLRVVPSHPVGAHWNRMYCKVGGPSHHAGTVVHTQDC